MEGIGQLAARRAAPPDTVNAPSDAGSAPSDGGIATSDGGIATLRPVTRRLKPVGARHAQFQSQGQFQNGILLQNLGRLQEPARLQNRATAAPFPAAGLDPVVATMDALRSAALSEARLFGFQEAAAFAGKVEEISRTVEFLQLVAAQAVDRTRNESQAARQPSAAPGWRTGWTEPDLAASEQAASEQAASEQAASEQAEPALNPVDDGYRNTAEFLRARLRISIGEARRRLTLASGVLPQTG
ncbi:HNH endonuclease signature motif containing protein, partial [Arthrobacter alkaliphilus]